MTVSSDDAGHQGLNDGVTRPSRRALFVIAAVAPVVFVRFDVLAAGWLLLVRRWQLAVVVLVARFGELACESLATELVDRGTRDGVPLRGGSVQGDPRRALPDRCPGRHGARPGVGGSGMVTER
jgi:hypothetical protein